MKTYNIGFIGAGIQSKRRIPAIEEFPNSNVVAITSKTLINAKKLSKQYNLGLYDDWKKLVADKDIDIIVIATYPNTHAEIAIEAFRHGKHVLCEKPLAKTIDEAEAMIQAAKKYKKILKCGFNHRFHPAIMQAKKVVEEGKIGNLLFGRGIYGHCGRPGFEKEWRTNATYTAGGILMEQGIHLIDLFLWFFGEFYKVSCFAETAYFPIAPFEDTAFTLLKTKKNQSVSIHSANIQWKNTFIFEIYGTDGYIKIDGLGASYGTEKLIIGKKNYTGPFIEEVFEYRGPDVSWKNEWIAFLDAIEKNHEPLGNGFDGYEAMKIVKAAYKSAKEEKVITL